MVWIDEWWKDEAMRDEVFMVGDITGWVKVELSVEVGTNACGALEIDFVGGSWFWW
jgi:hypothetical protein